jgi:16S rRNA U516 pseudouridylate synthase RsuA-like enzyme
MFEAIGYRVIELVRTTFAGIRLGKMREGEVRRLTDGEIRSLKKL